MRIYLRWFFVLFMVSTNVVSMDDVAPVAPRPVADKTFTVECPVLKVNNTVQTALLNFSHKGDRLVDFDFKNGFIPMTHFLSPGLNFHEQVSKHAEVVFSGLRNPRRKVMVDFDGVLSRRVLVQDKTGFQYWFILDTQNWSVQPNFKIAWKMLGEATEFHEAVKQVAQLLVGDGTLPATQADQAKLIEFATSIFVSKFERNEFAGEYSFRYERVSDELATFLQMQKASGAEIMVLSAKDFDSKKSEFLQNQYKGIFTSTSIKDLPCSPRIDADNSYIYSTNKGGALAALPGTDPKSCFEIMFLDDHAVIMKNYKQTVEYETLMKELCGAQYLFVPYPVLSMNFDTKKYLGDVLALFQQLPAKMLLEIQELLDVDEVAGH